jgi:formate hydrogenlyase transcriptional activator
LEIEIALREALANAIVHRINLDIEERKQAEFYLAEGQRLAHTGSWAFNSTGFQYWTPQLFAIHGLDPGRRAPSIPEHMTLVHSEDHEYFGLTLDEWRDTAPRRCRSSR